MIISLLPLLRGWSYRTKDIDIPSIINAGEKEEIFSVTGSGWIQYALVSVDNPLAVFSIVFQYAHKRRQELNTTAYSLKENGVTAPHPQGLWVSRYDDTAKIYTIMCAPTIYPPYNDQAACYIYSPPPLSTTFLGCSIVSIFIEDIDEFKKSFTELFAPTYILPLLGKGESKIQAERT
jgi:hypothetical protein